MNASKNANSNNNNGAINAYILCSIFPAKKTDRFFEIAHAGFRKPKDLSMEWGPFLLTIIHIQCLYRMYKNVAFCLLKIAVGKEGKRFYIVVIHMQRKDSLFVCFFLLFRIIVIYCIVQGCCPTRPFFQCHMLRRFFILFFFIDLTRQFDKFYVFFYVCSSF